MLVLKVACSSDTTKDTRFEYYCRSFEDATERLKLMEKQMERRLETIKKDTVRMEMEKDYKMRIMKAQTFLDLQLHYLSLSLHRPGKNCRDMFKAVVRGEWYFDPILPMPGPGQVKTLEENIKEQDDGTNRVTFLLNDHPMLHSFHSEETEPHVVESD